MAKTFDNISEASATNYLFLFAQRTLALQNEPPTPPPLNALGLPSKVIGLLCALLYPKDKAAEEKAALHKKKQAAAPAPAPVKEKAETLSEEASVQLKAAASANAAADKSYSSEELPANNNADATAVKTVAAAAGAVVAKDGAEAMDRKKKIAEKIGPLAEKITEYILDHQDDAAQEDRWRTTMKRDMVKSFREQREANEKSFHAQREESEKQREAINSRFDTQREAIDTLAKNFANANQG